MVKKLIKSIRIIFFLLIGIGLLLIAFRGVHPSDLLQELNAINFYWLSASLLLAFSGLIIRTYRWILLIEPLGYKPSVRNTFYGIMTGYLTNFILPRIGEITRCGSLNRTDKIPADSLFGTVITERIIDLLMIIVLTIVVFLIKINFFGTFILTSIADPILDKLAELLNFHWIIYLSLILIVVTGYFFFHINIEKLSQIKLFKKTGNAGTQIFKGMKTVIKMNKKIPFLIYTLLLWIAYFLMTWALFLSLPATSGLLPADALFIMVIGSYGMAAPVQGGIGAYHWIVSVGLGLYGIPRAEGLAFATLSHESQAILMILLGAFSMIMVYFITNRNNRRKHENTRDNSIQNIK